MSVIDVGANGMIDFAVVAETLLKKPVIRQAGWSADTLAYWLRDGCKCVYCDRDMLASRDVAVMYQHHEHLLPKAKYPQFENSWWNFVLSCQACNSYKHAFDPNFDGIFDTSSSVPSEDVRRSLLARARGHVAEARAKCEATFKEEAALLREALRTIALRMAKGA